MKYKSTRQGVKGVSFKETVIGGLASDGGLIIPEAIPLIDLKLLKNLSYRELALKIFEIFIDDMGEDILRKLIDKSYHEFSVKEVVALKKLKGFYILELFYGPTLSFKDIALQLLGNFFEYILEEDNNYMNILAATSGDTGSAAIYSLKDKANINVFILHPYKAISSIQELQKIGRASCRERV